VRRVKRRGLERDNLVLVLVLVPVLVVPHASTR
jgi:hypothetical protein